jgi:hypothetical protein
MPPDTVPGEHRSRAALAVPADLVRSSEKNSEGATGSAKAGEIKGGRVNSKNTRPLLTKLVVAG